MANKTSHHILNSAANLLGFCLFVITSYHIANVVQSTLIDEITSVVALFLAFSCSFSFISIRLDHVIREQRFENIADILFLSSLIGILVIIFLITLNLI